jgi:hypothetical protein
MELRDIDLTKHDTAKSFPGTHYTLYRPKISLHFLINPD